MGGSCVSLPLSAIQPPSSLLLNVFSYVGNVPPPLLEERLSDVGASCCSVSRSYSSYLCFKLRESTRSDRSSLRLLPTLGWRNLFSCLPTEYLYWSNCVGLPSLSLSLSTPPFSLSSIPPLSIPLILETVVCMQPQI